MTSTAKKSARRHVGTRVARRDDAHTRIGEIPCVKRSSHSWSNSSSSDASAFDEIEIQAEE